MHDLLFCGARLIDGSGSPARLADVAVDAGLISAICDVAHTGQRRAARHVVECGGLVLAPGFIDAHTHDDALMLEKAPLDQAHPKLSQGVTTVVIGNCGISLAPLDAAVHRDLPPPLNILKREAFRFSSVAAYLDALADRPPVCNVVTLLGHTSLRVKHLPDLQQEATAEQAAVMAAEVGAALQQGAWGLSTGVFYTPARAATKDELIAVARPLGPAGALLTMHIRDDAAQIDAALQEAFEVARGADAALVISHHKLSGRANHGRSAKTLAMIEAAGLRQDVCVDCYPYDASSTMLIPDRVHLSREVLITWSSTEPAAAGRSLFQMAKERGVDASGTGRATRASGRGELLNGRGRRAENHAAPPDDDRLRRPAARPTPPPRLWGSFPRVLGRYARNQGLFPLETAVRKMTAWPAARFGLDRATPQRAARGQIKSGWAADLVLFDPEQVLDNASYTSPMQPSSGISAVYLYGELAAANGLTVNAHAGRALRRVG